MGPAAARGGIHVDDVGVVLDGNHILQHIDLHVSPGDWLGVIGPNGAGKTTLLRAIGGLAPRSGTIEVDGIDPAHSSRRAMARAVAYVPQDPLIPEAMTVRDFALLGRTAHLPYLGVEGRRDHELVSRILARLDLQDLSGRSMTTLSGGERQRAVLARALAQEARVLLLDEPTSALDVGHQQQVLELVEGLRQEHGLTIITAMHDLTLAGQFADRLLLLSVGQVAAHGSAATVLTEGTLARHWGATVRVLRDPDGTVLVIPIRRGAGGSRRRTDERDGEGRAAH